MAFQSECRRAIAPDGADACARDRACAPASKARWGRGVHASPGMQEGALATGHFRRADAALSHQQGRSRHGWAHLPPPPSAALPSKEDISGLNAGPWSIVKPPCRSSFKYREMSARQRGWGDLGDAHTRRAARRCVLCTWRAATTPLHAPTPPTHSMCVHAAPWRTRDTVLAVRSSVRLAPMHVFICFSLTVTGRSSRRRYDNIFHAMFQGIPAA